MRTPLHPQAFRYQVSQDNELYKEMQAEKTHKRLIGKWLGYAWCSALCTTTREVVMDLWLPAGLVIGRLLIAMILSVRFFLSSCTR